MVLTRGQLTKSADEINQSNQTENGDSLEKMAFSLETALKIIPEFKGVRTELHKFISCCDVVAANTKDDAKPLLLSVIQTRLGGSAYNLVKHRNFANWNELKLCLQDQFLETRSISQLQTDLINCKQSYNESAREFGTRIEKLLSDLNDACISCEGPGSRAVIESLNSKMAFNSFVEGLNFSLRLIIKASRFNSLNAAIESAVEEERIQVSKNLKQKQNSNPKTNFVTHFKPKHSGIKKCDFCGKTGHLESECFKKSSPSQSLPQFHKRDIKSEVLINQLLSCAYCKKIGHHIRDCFKKKRADEFKVSATSLQSTSGNSKPAGAIGSVSRRVQEIN